MARILISDDDLICSRLIAKWLEHAHDLVAVEGGIDALRLLEAESFDLLVTDIANGQMDGYRLIEKVHHSFQGLPIVILSGMGLHQVWTEEEMGREWRERGVVAYVEKPASMVTIREAIEYALHEGDGVRCRLWPNL